MFSGRSGFSFTKVGWRLWQLCEAQHNVEDVTVSGAPSYTGESQGVPVPLCLMSNKLLFEQPRVHLLLFGHISDEFRFLSRVFKSFTKYLFFSTHINKQTVQEQYLPWGSRVSEWSLRFVTFRIKGVFFFKNSFIEHQIFIKLHECLQPFHSVPLNLITRIYLTDRVPIVL